MKTYTVIGTYWDTDQPYSTWAEAPSSYEAVSQTQAGCFADNGYVADDFDADDPFVPDPGRGPIRVIAVPEGRHEGLPFDVPERGHRRHEN